jgi:hypothetical protein
VASADGSAYFLSPELLDAAAQADGVDGDPNLYLAEPGSAPQYVSTLELDNQVVLHSVSEAATRYTADFQTTPDGDNAVFVSTQSLTGYENDGHLEIYRYEALGGDVECVSCAPTNARATGDASLARNGLSLIDDGRVFFTSTEPLVLRDTNSKKDAYEWVGPGQIQLISTGTSGFDSGLLSATADGRDVYFFTRDTLAKSDQNGVLMKIYDAREGGGFFVVSEGPGCAASDECHGPGSAAPPVPDFPSVSGTPRNFSPDACAALSRRATQNSNRAKRLRKRATRSSNAGQARALRRRAEAAAKKARTLRARARACRRSSGGNG